MDNFSFENRLGFGTLRLPLDKLGNVDTHLVCTLFDEYLSQGGKYFEAAFDYFQAEETVRKCLTERYPRDKYWLADKMPLGIRTLQRYGGYESIFNQQLTRCGVDYFDFYLLHNLGHRSYLYTESLDGFSFIKKLKDNGLTRWIGFSFHDKAEVLEKILGKYRNDFDFIQLQINYLDWESPVIESRKCYEVAQKYEMPVFVMEPVKGGRLIDLPLEALKIMKRSRPGSTPASWAIEWVLGYENIACVLSGMNSMEQVRENLHAANRSSGLSQEEQNVIARVVELIQKERIIQCTYCRYCVPECPKKIPIPELLNLYENDNLEHVGRMYQRITETGGKAGSCLKCGKCEQVCSQHLEIRKYLSDIAAEYERKRGN